MDITICVAAFNRPNSLKRILNSLAIANYDGDKVRLYISVDKSKENSKNNLECVSIAKDFKWEFGDKIVDYKKENLGLRKHILACGNLTKTYENIIMFEDDIIVSKSFYLYAKKVLEFYKNDDNIAGFGLYSYQKCPLTRIPFYPLQTEYDTFFMQYACSWGQMWTKRQWDSFYEWYEKNHDKDLHDTNFPNAIADWKNSSWLKYYMKYIVETNKYFVYPYKSYTTNFSDVGTHFKVSDIGYQTLISNHIAKEYNFCSLNDTLAVYDIYFENKKLDKLLNKEITVDFYNSKSYYNNRYLLTTRKLNYKIVKSFGISLYSYENNIIYNIEGNDLFLYDTMVSQKNKIKNNFNFHNYIYRIGELTKREYLKFLLSIFNYAVRKYLKRK